jgi:ribosomal protein L11 methylase PrmA
VVANITADVLLKHAVDLSAALRSGAEGGLVLSGLRGDAADHVAARYAHLLATEAIHTALGDWHCLRFG